MLLDERTFDHLTCTVCRLLHTFTRRLLATMYHISGFSNSLHILMTIFMNNITLLLLRLKLVPFHCTGHTKFQPKCVLGEL